MALRWQNIHKILHQEFFASFVSTFSIIIFLGKVSFLYFFLPITFFIPSMYFLYNFDILFVYLIIDFYRIIDISTVRFLKNFSCKCWFFLRDFRKPFLIHGVSKCLIFISTSFFWNVTYNSKKTFMKLLYASLGVFDGKNQSHIILLKRYEKVGMLSSVISV